jgi:hypothetical protein
MAPKTRSKKLGKWMSFDPWEKGAFARAIERLNARRRVYTLAGQKQPALSSAKAILGTSGSAKNGYALGGVASGA